MSIGIRIIIIIPSIGIIIRIIDYALIIWVLVWWRWRWITRIVIIVIIVIISIISIISIIIIRITSTI